MAKLIEMSTEELKLAKNDGKLAFFRLEYQPHLYTEFCHYHSQIKDIFETLSNIDDHTVCDPPISYRLYRSRKLAQNPALIYIDCSSQDENVDMLAPELRALFSEIPIVKKISKGQMELLDSRRSPVLFICPIKIPRERIQDAKVKNQIRPKVLQTLNDSEDNPLSKNDSSKIAQEKVEDHGYESLSGRPVTTSKSHDKEKSRILEKQNRSGLHTDAFHSIDQGYDSLPSNLPSTINIGHSTDGVAEYIRRQVKTTVPAMRCISDDHATSVVFLVVSEENDCKQDRLIAGVKIALRKQYPYIFGNRTEDASVYLADDRFPNILDTLFMNLLQSQLITLQSSLDMIEKDFDCQDMQDFRISNSQLSYLFATVSKLVVPDKQRLHDIAETVKRKSHCVKNQTSTSYSEFLRNEIVTRVIEDAHEYIDREFSNHAKVTVSRALKRSRHHICTNCLRTDYLMRFFIVLIVVVLYVLTGSGYYLVGLAEAMGYGILISVIFARLEMSYFNTNRVVQSVQGELKNLRDEIKDDIIIEVKKTNEMLHNRSETVHEIRNRITEMSKDISVKITTTQS